MQDFCLVTVYPCDTLVISGLAFYFFTCTSSYKLKKAEKWQLKKAWPQYLKSIYCWIEKMATKAGKAGKSRKETFWKIANYMSLCYIIYWGVSGDYLTYIGKQARQHSAVEWTAVAMCSPNGTQSAQGAEAKASQNLCSCSACHSRSEPITCHKACIVYVWWMLR